MNDQSIIPFQIPEIGEDEIQEVVATLRSGWLTSGERTARFEHDFAAYTGARHALAVNSCTAGLHLALAALGLGPGDEVITTPLTFCATVNTILHVGATPVLADIGPDGNIDPDAIAARITPRTRAIVPVHFAGYPCDMDRIWRLARQHNLFVVEDAAHAAGTLYKGLPIGSSQGEFASDAVAFSFYATKNMTTGEGGMVTTGRAELAARMKVLCLHGISKDAWNRYSNNGNWYYQVLEAGFKYNLSDIQSAIGIHQLRKLERFTATRIRWAKLYNEHFRDIEELEIPPDSLDGRHCWHLYTLRLRPETLSISRDEFIVELRRRGVGASVHFIPIPLHPFFAEWAGRPENQCPKAMGLYQRMISLPLYSSMTEEQVERAAAAVKDIVIQSRAQAVAAGAGVHAGGFSFSS
jgi:dTDP-4-amino-4,6-dideoxygalactose transaminase